MNHEELLKNKLESIFPNQNEQERAIDILTSYGVEGHEQEPFRVRLAVLKLTGSDLAEIEKTTKLAKEDFRDILTWAEYPRQSHPARSRPLRFAHRRCKGQAVRRRRLMGRSVGHRKF